MRFKLHSAPCIWDENYEPGKSIVDPQRQLTGSWAVLCARDLSEGRCIWRLVGSAEPMLVEGIEQLRTNLNGEAFTNGGSLD